MEHEIVEVLEPAEAEAIDRRIHDQRDEWLARAPGTPFYTLGAATPIRRCSSRRPGGGAWRLFW